MEFKERVSVIVPVYNSGKYLKKCIKSILAQTYGNMELLLINDGSTDNSDEICEKFSKIDSRVRVFYKDNGGVSSARNLGLQEAQGEYIAFVDADDFIVTEYLKTLVHDIKKYHTDIVQCGFQELYPDGRIKKKGKKQSCIINLDDSFNYCKNNEIGFVWGKLFRKQCLAGIVFDPGISMSEDALFTAEVIRSSTTLYYEKQILYTYRIHLESAMHGAKNMPDMTVLDARKKIFYMQNTDSVAFYSAGMKYLEMCRRIAAEIWVLKMVNTKQIFYLRAEVQRNWYLIWKSKERLVQKILLQLFICMPDLYFGIFARKKKLNEDFLKSCISRSEDEAKITL